jgi:hypothetical protein
MIDDLLRLRLRLKLRYRMDVGLGENNFAKAIV